MLEPNIQTTNKKNNIKKTVMLIRIFILILILLFIAWISYRMWYHQKREMYSDWQEGLGISVEEKNGAKKYGYVNEKFKLVIPHQFDSVSSFEDGYAITGTKVGKDMRYRVINKEGRYVGAFYDSIGYIGNDRFRVRNRLKGKKEGQELPQDYRWQLMTTQGTIISKRFYTDIDFYQEDRAMVCVKKQCGFVDVNGTEVVLLSEKIGRGGRVFDFRGSRNNADGTPRTVRGTHTASIQNGMSIIQENGLYGYMNSNGKVIVKPKFISAEPFKSNRAIVQTEKGLGVIDTNGKFIVNPDKGYEKIEPFFDERAIFKKDGFAGVIDINGKEIVSTNKRYSSISTFNGQYAGVSRNNLWGFIDSTGKEIVPPIYEHTGGFEGGQAWGILPENPKEMLIFDANHRILSKKELTVF